MTMATYTGLCLSCLPCVAGATLYVRCNFGDAQGELGEFCTSQISHSKLKCLLWRLIKNASDILSMK